MKLHPTQSALIKLVMFISTFSGCAGQRLLTVKSDPADAEVCLKGRPGSRYLTNKKYCVGTTPFAAETVELVSVDGKKRKLDLSDLDDEQFDVIVGREGYAPQSVAVPSWDHFIALKPELKQVVSPQPAPAAETEQGSVKISSDPVGALIYVNDYVKGNTPYTVEASNGQVLRIKLEQPGYAATEKSVTVEGGKTLEVKLQLAQEAKGEAVVSQAAKK